MKKKSKDQGHLIVVNEDGAQRTESGDGMDGIRCRSTLWRYNRPWHAPCSSERRGVIKERREGSLDEGGVRVVMSKKEERREGCLVRGRGRGSRADRRPGKGEVYSARGRRVWHDVEAMRGQGANGLDTDGIHGARGDSDPTCVAWSSWAQCLGLDIHSGFSKHSLLPKANFFQVFFFPSLPCPQYAPNFV